MKIALIDDKADFGKVTAESLRRKGLDVTYFPKSDDLIEAVIHLQPSLAICDSFTLEGESLSICAELMRRLPAAAILLSSSNLFDNSVQSENKLKVARGDVQFSVNLLEARRAG